MKRPNFLILGAAKSGTNSLYHYLGQHPDVFLSTPKEPFYFEAEYEKGLKFYWDTYFNGWNGQRAVGEARVANLFLPYIPQRIKESLPQSKLIVTLRNPTHRAYSHWWMRYSRGVDDLLFKEALRENLARINAGINFEGKDGEGLWRASVSNDKSHVKIRVYIDAGYYARQIERYLHLFPRSQIKIILLDDWYRQPLSIVRELFEFIGVEPNVPLTEVAPQNAAFTTAAMPFLKLERTLKLSKVVPRKLSSSMRTLLSKFGKKPSLDTVTRRWLIDHYLPHNRELEKTIGRDLSHWDR